MTRAALSLAHAGPWAIHPDAMTGYLRGLLAADGRADLFADADPGEVEAMYAARGDRAGTVAVVPVLGPITKRDSIFTLLFGGSSTTRLSAQLRALAADESVATVLLNVDSPGGTVSGLPELAAEVRRTAQVKRVVAIANDMAASAAYWIAAQASEVVATPEAVVGSVGVFTMHQDWSGALEQAGVRTTLIQAGEHKTEGNPFEPLSEEARDHIQSLVDDAYAMFVADVATGRSREGAPVTAAKVRADYGKGRVISAKDAKAAGMVDRVETYSQTLARLSGVKPAGIRAEVIAEAFDVPADVVPDDTVGMVEQQQANAEALRRARWELDADRWLLNR